MRISVTKFTIVTKERPTKIYAGNGNLSEFFEDVFLFDFRQSCDDELATFDEPEKFECAEVNIWMEV